MTKAERTKQFILEQAGPVYNEKGLSGTGIDDILAATKLTKGALYSHFENKEDLSIQTTDYLLQKICAEVDKTMRKEKTAKGMIFAYLDFHKNPLNTYIKGGCPIFNFAVEADDNYPAVKQKVTNVLEVSQRNFRYILSEGIKNKEFKATLDPALYAFKMFAAIEGATIMCRNMNTNQPMKGLIKSLKAELEAFEVK